MAETIDDNELVVNAQVKIKTLLKEFAKGINTIEIARFEGDSRISASLIIDIEI